MQLHVHIINAAPLLDRINGAAATKCYIENITDSSLDKSLDPIVRMEKKIGMRFFIHYWWQTGSGYCFIHSLH